MKFPALKEYGNISYRIPKRGRISSKKGVFRSRAAELMVLKNHAVSKENVRLVKYIRNAKKLFVAESLTRKLGRSRATDTHNFSNWSRDAL